MKNDVPLKSSVGVIGAGIQGICVSLHLIKKGFQVTLIDKDDPGTSSASYGNAGHFSPYASLSLNRPDILIDVPSMLLSTTGPLSLKWNYVPKMIPWFLRFIKNCTKKKMMHTAKYMHQILDLALPAYDELFQEIDVSGLVESRGIIYFWTDKDLKSRELEINGHVEGKITADTVIVGKSAVIKGDIFFRNTLKTEEGADIDGYIKRVNNGKVNTEEDIAIEEIVERREQIKPKVVPVAHHKEAV